MTFLLCGRDYKVQTLFTPDFLILISRSGTLKECDFDSLRAIFSETPVFCTSNLLQFANSFWHLAGEDADCCNLKRGCLFLFPGPISLLLGDYTNHIELLMLHGEMRALEL
jgi:hypothetical protein